MEEYKQKTIDSYNLNANKFSEKFRKLMDAKKRYEFQKFIDMIPGKKMLDLGSGSGDHAYYFSQKRLDVTCIDLSKEMLNLSKNKGLKGVVMDIENLGFKKESFEGIWAVTSLLHVPKIKMPKIANDIYQILKDKGILYISVKEGKGERFIEDGDNLKRYFCFWEKNEFKNVFEKSFDLIEFKRMSFGKSLFLEYFFQKR